MISVVVPCHNEQEVFEQLTQHLTAAAETWGEPFEVLLVNDGSRDGTWELMKLQHQRDPRWKALDLSRNFGHQTAVSAGIYHASGDCVVVLDADLQDPPDAIGRFIEKWRQGYDVVYGIRTKRKENWLKRMCYSAFYRVLRRLADIDIPPDSGDFCLIARNVVDTICAMPERNRFVRGLRAWAGFKQIGLPYERHERAAGEVKYTPGRLVKLALDGIFSFSTVPLRMASYFGFVISLLAAVGVVFTLAQRIFLDFFSRIGLRPVPGFATIVIAILFLGGVQLICLGIIGEYLGRVYEEVKGRPPWVVREAVGLSMGSTQRSPGVNRIQQA